MRGDLHLDFFGVNLAAEYGMPARSVRSRSRPGAQPRDARTCRRSREFGYPGFAFDAWFGMLAPSGVPKPILDKISRDVAAAMASPDVFERLTKQGLEVDTNTPDAFEAISRTTSRYGKMLRDAGLAVN